MSILTFLCYLLYFLFSSLSIWWKMFVKEYIWRFLFLFLESKLMFIEDEIPNIRLIIAFPMVASTITYKYQEERERMHKVNFIKACHYYQRLMSIQIKCGGSVWIQNSIASQLESVWSPYSVVAPFNFIWNVLLFLKGTSMNQE